MVPHEERWFGGPIILAGFGGGFFVPDVIVYGHGGMISSPVCFSQSILAKISVGVENNWIYLLLWRETFKGRASDSHPKQAHKNIRTRAVTTTITESRAGEGRGDKGTAKIGE